MSYTDDYAKKHMVLFERAIVVSYRLTIALSRPIRQQCDTQINRSGSLWGKIWGFPIGVDTCCWVLSNAN